MYSLFIKVSKAPYKNECNILLQKDDPRHELSKK